MKNLVILGSTGSIGTQTLELVERFPEELSVVALAAGRNIELFAQQIKCFRPSLVSVARHEDVSRLREAIGDLNVEIVVGREGLNEVASIDADLLIAALVGAVGLEPVFRALQNGTDIALANKEVLVVAGELVMREAELHGARVLPLDSEHVAIHQCLAGHPREALRRVVLTASGGPFREASLDAMRTATVEQALAHPNWEMGQKITIDSATLMNKGFEIIEARWLFDLRADQIDVWIHPESIVHSLVEYTDGSWLSQLGMPDMRTPIAYTLGMPDRLPLPDLERLDLAEIGALHFERPDATRFPAVALVGEVLRRGGAAAAIMNAANEIAVEAFLKRRIGFTAIVETAEKVLERMGPHRVDTLDALLETDRVARAQAETVIEELSL